MSESIFLQLITTAGVVIVAVLQTRDRRAQRGHAAQLDRIGADASEARQQTANSHGTNLRDDMDRIERKVDGVREDVRHLHEDDADLDDTVSRSSARTRRALTQAVDERNELLDRLREEIPVMVQRGLTKHVRDCPVRTPPAPPA